MAPFEKPPHINTDIVLQILSHLHYFPGALQQCSLVCKPWVYPSQIHLFRTLRIENDPCTRSFDHLLRHLQEHTRLASFVKHLVLLKEKGENRKRLLDAGQFHDVISLLPSLISVKIQDLVLDAEGIRKEQELADSIRRGQPHIRTLLLDGVSATRVDFACFLQLVSSIETLHITDSWTIVEGTSCDSPLTVNLITLRHVKLSHSSLGSGLIQQLSETGSRLRSLSIAEHDPIAPDVLRRLTYHSSLSLRQLCLDLNTVASDRDRNQMKSLRHLDLASFHSLCELKVTMKLAWTDYELHDPSLDTQWTSLLALVESCAATCIIISISPPQYGPRFMGSRYMKQLTQSLLNDWWTILQGLEWHILDDCLASKTTVPQVGFIGEKFGTHAPLYTREYLGNVLEENIRLKMLRMSSLGRIRFWNGDGGSENWWFS